MPTVSESRAEALETAVESLAEGLAVLDEDGRYVEMNRAHADVYGYEEPDDLVGEHWSVCYGDEELERFDSAVMPTVEEAGEWHGEAVGRRKDGSHFPQELSLTALDDGGLVCVVRDVSERVETETLYRTVAENIPGGAVFLFDDGLRYTLVAGRAFRSLDVTTDELEGRAVQEVIPEDQREAVVARYESVLEGESSQFELEFGGRVFDVSLHPLDALHDVHAGIGIAQDITERHRRERSLRALHEASRQLTYVDTVEETARVTVDIAEEVLDWPLSTLWRYDAATDGLRALSITDSSADVLGVEAEADLQPLTGDDLGMEVFREGSTRSIADYEDSGVGTFDAAFGSVLEVPLGDYGLLAFGRHETGEFTDADRRRAETLGANAQAALESAENERLLRERTDELETRTTQMEFINSILRHDVLNGMTVIRSRAAFLEEDLEGRQYDHAETILRWCDDITAFVERVQAVLNALGSQDSLAVESVDVADVLREEVARLSQTYPDVTFEVDLPTTVVVQADELLADVVGNIATNAIEHNDVDGLTVRVSAERQDDVVQLRIADNGQGVAPEHRESVFRRGESHAKMAGSGFGLFFVDAMVDAYGGEIRVEDNDPGAAFVLELPPAAEGTGGWTGEASGAWGRNERD
jgi:PAS domain S-box-containing protein